MLWIQEIPHLKRTQPQPKNETKRFISHPLKLMTPGRLCRLVPVVLVDRWSVATANATTFYSISLQVREYPRSRPRMGSLFIAYLEPLTGSVLPRMLDPVRLISPNCCCGTRRAQRKCLWPGEGFLLFRCAVEELSDFSYSKSWKLLHSFGFEVVIFA